MAHLFPIFKPKTSLSDLSIAFIAFFIFMSFPTAALALTPIARTDVVPFQRIEYGTTFKFGVVAFSKAGINRVDFAISGQGYSGGTKTSSTMALNSRLAHVESEVSHASWPGVYEYFVEISSSEFTSNGAITVTPTVRGSDGGSRSLPAVTLIVEATKAYTHNFAIVNSSTGNDSSGQANSSTNKFKTIGAAVAVAQAANGGSSDGNVIYLEAGTYTLGGSSPNTTNEWLTIKNADGVSRDNITIDNGGKIGVTNLIKLEGVTLYAGTGADHVINNGNKASTVWIHNCKMTSIGRWRSTNESGTVDNPECYPVRGPSYVTNSYYYNVDRGCTADLARNVTLKKIAEDAFRNNNLVVNARVDDQDNGSNDGYDLNYHADTFQNFGNPPNNQILYNLYATDLHYQGLFLRTSSGTAKDAAYINNFFEMRSPANFGGVADVLTAGAFYFDDDDWDHVLLWHCSFQGSGLSMYVPSGSGHVRNASIIGNVFLLLKDGGAAGAGKEIPSFEYGNTDNNEVLYNHYQGAYTELTGCGGNPQPAGCPHWYSKASDSSSNRTTFSHGGKYYPEVLDKTDDTTYTNFGTPDPDDGAILKNRMPSNLTGLPADVFGNPRDSKPDLGAIEGGRRIPRNLSF